MQRYKLNDGMNIIETKNLSFRYKGNNILEGIDLQVPKGSIYGYLGKNGAGKTTTIKLLLGLLEANEGNICIKGKELNKNRNDILYSIGNMIESPCFYHNLTVLENLQYLDIVFGLGKDRIKEVLELVGLQDVPKKISSKLSSGMKQRLSIAMAIFHNPDILILDEPLNGLDPMGIRDMRNLLLELNERGTTIFLSSHITSELEMICSHIGILSKGKLLYQGALEELKSNDKREISITNNNPVQAFEICKSMQLEAKIEKDNMLKVAIHDDKSHNALIRSLVDSDIDIYAIQTSMCNLESTFLAILSKNDDNK